MVMTTLPDRALTFAAKAHEGQRRKYTGEFYLTHVMEVCEIVRQHGGTEEMQAAALLHDTMEDTSVIYLEIKEAFGRDVADMVSALTDDEEGNRATRKRLSRERLSAASAEVQTIKLADLISNSRSIIERDPEFAKVYLREKVALLLVLTKGDARLWNTAAAFIPSEYMNEARENFSASDAR